MDAIGNEREIEIETLHDAMAEIEKVVVIHMMLDGQAGLSEAVIEVAVYVGAMSEATPASKRDAMAEVLEKMGAESAAAMEMELRDFTTRESGDKKIKLHLDGFHGMLYDGMEITGCCTMVWRSPEYLCVHWRRSQS